MTNLEQFTETVRRGLQAAGLTADELVEALQRLGGAQAGTPAPPSVELREVIVPSCTRRDARLVTRVLTGLGAIVELDRDIRRRVHLMVCHIGDDRVVLEVPVSYATAGQLGTEIAELAASAELSPRKD